MMKILVSETDLDKLGIMSRKTRYRLRRRGEFPAPLRVSPRRLLYKWVEVERWIKNRELGCGKAN